MKRLQRGSLLALLAMLCALGAVVAQETSSTEVRITVQRLTDGRTEFALQQRNDDQSWGERILPRGRFFPANGPTGRWLNSTPVTLSESVGGLQTDSGMEVRITVRLDESGRLEFALQQREDDEWGERQLPRSRFLPASPTVGRWLSSSALTFTAPKEIAKSEEVEQVNEVPTKSDLVCKISNHSDRIATATFQVQTGTATGTAFYIGQDEWLTNHHVVDGVSQVLLVRAEYSITATVIGSLPGSDLALLRAPAPYAVVPLVIAVEQQPLGSNVSVLGFPPSVSGTPSLTRGVVSKHSSFSEFPGFTGTGSMVQIDAPINPGNSGGPMVNDCGEVIGVATLKLFTTADGLPVEGIGFGVAGITVRNQLPNLRVTTHIATATEQDRSVVAEIGVPVSGEERSKGRNFYWEHHEFDEDWVSYITAIGVTGDRLYPTARLAIICFHKSQDLVITLSARTNNGQDRLLNTRKDTVVVFSDANGEFGNSTEFLGWPTSDRRATARNKSAAAFMARAVQWPKVGFSLPTLLDSIYSIINIDGLFTTPIQPLLERCLTE